jgi:hypothetical protein
MERRERETTVTEKSSEPRRESSSAIREARESGLGVLDASCRLLSNFLTDLGEALAPRPRRARDESVERGDRAAGECEEFAVVCRSFARAGEGSSARQEEEAGREEVKVERSSKTTSRES